MLLNTGFWEIACFVIFVALIFRPLKNFANSSLLTYSNTIKNKIDEATALRLEAERFLAQYQADHKRISDKSKQILANTDENINLIASEFETKLRDQIATKKRMYQEKIAVQHKERLLQLKVQAIQDAVIATKSYLQANVTKTLNPEEISSVLQLVNDNKITQ